MLGLLAATPAVSSTVSLVTRRRSLRRVVVPVPDQASMVPARKATARLVGSVLSSATMLSLSILGVVSPAVLGAGVGAQVGLLWSARKIAEFERDAGRRVRRATRRRRGEPALYAAAAT